MGPPDPPAGVPSVCCSTEAITINWRSSPYDGGCAVTGYTVEMNRLGESSWTTVAESCHSLSHTVPASGAHTVLPDQRYRFRVRAENIHGVSEPGNESEHVRIPEAGATLLDDADEDFEPPFEARVVEMEDRRLFDDRYDVLEDLGKGQYGTVRRVVEKSSGISFAAKFVRTIKAKDREQVREEIRIMNMLRHPKLLLLAAAFESPREIVMVTEYISGDELFERVVADDFTLTERDSILFMRQICEGVEYMHQNNVVHLDLKPENIMCRTRTSHQIKLIDFGLAQVLKPGTPVRVLLGTPEFIPPEIISYEPIGTESDMWSVGVICYVLLTGLSPFMGDSNVETYANIIRVDYDLEDEAFDAISNDAKDFISGLLIKRKELRMSARQCLEHPWMAQHAEAMSRVALPTEKLKKFIVRRKWQKTGNAIRAVGRMAILSANSRRSPTTSAESSPTSEPSSNPIEYPRSTDSDAPVDDQSSCNLGLASNKDESSPIETDTRGRNMYSFCYKTEVVIFPDERLDSSLKRDALAPSSLDEASLKSELPRYVTRSCSQRDVTQEIQETDTAEDLSTVKTGDQSDGYLDRPVASRELEEEIETMTQMLTEQPTLTSDEASIMKNTNSKARDLSNTFGDTVKSQCGNDETLSTVYEEVFSRSTSDEETKISESYEIHSTLKVEEERVNEEKVTFRVKEKESKDRLNQETSANSQKSRRVFRGHSEDSGVDHCITNSSTSSQQANELGISSIIDEEDSQNNNGNVREMLRRTKGFEYRETSEKMADAPGNAQKSANEATFSGVTKQSRASNRHEVASEVEDPRLLIGRVRSKFVPTGNVSRTAKLFQKEATPTVATKPKNERIQKAFAFWNK